jgi:hypothetical protein
MLRELHFDVLGGFANSLGVSGVHCHIPGEWEKDDKPANQIARDMWKMMHAIDNDLLKNIGGLTPVVMFPLNC